VNWTAGGIYNAVPAALRGWISDTVVPRLPAPLRRYADRSFVTRPVTPEALFFDNFAAVGLERQRTLLSPAYADLATAERAYGPSRAYFDAPNGHSTILDRLLYADLKTYLVELLMKQDQMSMAASIESRVPFLDHELVEFAAMLPNRLKLRGFKTKWILREAVRDLLPAEILSRPKMGFPVPFGEWMRGPWNTLAREILLDPRTCRRGIFNRTAVERLMAGHVSGAANGSDAIWSLLNLELWYRTFIDGDGMQTLPVAPARPGTAANQLQAIA
jgi:asparagine synthase (glutamine-hydrolysing)